MSPQALGEEIERSVAPEDAAALPRVIAARDAALDLLEVPLSRCYFTDSTWLKRDSLISQSPPDQKPFDFICGSLIALIAVAAPMACLIVPLSFHRRRRARALHQRRTFPAAIVLHDASLTKSRHV